MGRIGNLVDRLGRLTHQLKVFAHKSSDPVAPVNVRKSVDDALFIVSARIRERGIVVAARVEPEDLAVVRRGDAARAGARQSARQCDRCG